MKSILLLLSCVLAMGAVAADAPEVGDDELAGEITALDESNRTITLRVTAVGDDVDATVGQTETYRIDDETNIHMEDAAESILTPIVADFDDLNEGQEVILDFEEVQGARVARNVRDQRLSREDVERTDIAAAEADEDEEGDQLPATASPLPLLAMLGGCFAVIALGLRVARR